MRGFGGLFQPCSAAAPVSTQPVLPVIPLAHAPGAWQDRPPPCRCVSVCPTLRAHGETQLCSSFFMLALATLVLQEEAGGGSDVAVGGWSRSSAWALPHLSLSPFQRVWPLSCGILQAWTREKGLGAQGGGQEKVGMTPAPPQGGIWCFPGVGINQTMGHTPGHPHRASSAKVLLCGKTNNDRELSHQESARLWVAPAGSLGRGWGGEGTGTQGSTGCSLSQHRS